jgi:cytochrome c551/c552
MALVTNSVTTYGTTTNREDLADIIYNISPSDTPLFSMAGKTNATNVLHEWSTDALEAVNTGNAQLEGDEVSRSASTQPVRVQNYCQILRKDATVTGTQEASDPAGMGSNMDYQKAKKGLALRKDIEYALLGPQAQNAGNATTAREMRGFNSFISGNGSRGTGGVDSANATTDVTDGTQRALTEDLLKDAILDAYTDGGEPDVVLVGPFNKQVASTFAGRTTARENVTVGTIQGAASIYASDFGDMKIMPSRTQRERDAFVIDTSKVKVASLRNFETNSLGKIGDAETDVIYWEGTLEMCNADAHAVIADLTTS